MEKKLNCILLVDDDQPTNFIHKKILETAGCTETIKTAINGFDALKYLEKANKHEADYPAPDLILLDINMPAMNGWEFLEKYEADEQISKDKVIVMLTTSPNPDDLQKAKEIKTVAGFENKPLTKTKIQMILDEYFGNQNDMAA